MIRDAELTVRVKKIAQDLGAKIVGVAEADRFGEAPEGYRPNDILEDAESVVVLAIPLLKGVLRNAPSREYFLNYFMVNNELNIIALHLGWFLESEGYETVPIPTAQPYNVDEYRGDFSHRHAAVLAGIGCLGKNNLLITKNYGPRVRLVSIVTNAPLSRDEPLNENFCEGCEACINFCPVNALETGYTDKEKCGSHLKKIGKQLNTSELFCGICIKVCPIGK
ncbi:MAG: 4Fe-4S binding protein [Candidatus Freyarchaeum deiterrae]